MKRFIAVILTLTLTLSLVPVAFAATDEASRAAQALYDLGLFQGTGYNADGTPNFDLDRTPTRAEAVTMLVRLLGKDAEAQAGSWTIPFTDVADWAKPYVGYAYTNGLTTGTGATTFGGEQPIDATQYLTLMLRALGYESGTDFLWEQATQKAAEVGLTSNWSQGSTFTRGDVAILSNCALSLPQKGETVYTPGMTKENFSVKLTGVHMGASNNSQASYYIENNTGGDVSVYMITYVNGYSCWVNGEVKEVTVRNGQTTTLTAYRNLKILSIPKDMYVDKDSVAYLHATHNGEQYVVYFDMNGTISVSPEQYKKQ